jgi:hypothetical protein
MRIAHEAPLSLMKYVKQVTDYDYALASLFDNVSGYYEYFKQSKKEGRKILLDNGVFEEGVAMKDKDYVNWIKDLQPDEYIVPDVMGDMHRTVVNFQKWLLEYQDLPGKKIGVVHGYTIEEFIECYKYMSTYADKIAINFSQSFYQEIYPQQQGMSKEIKQAQGRLWITGHLHSLGIWNAEKPHHLLGASVPSEFSAYVERHPSFVYKSIESIDTSNPIVYAIVKGRYPKHISGVVTKETTKVKDLITTPYSDKLLIDVIANVIQFRTQNNL